MTCPCLFCHPLLIPRVICLRVVRDHPRYLTYSSSTLPVKRRASISFELLGDLELEFTTTTTADLVQFNHSYPHSLSPQRQPGLMQIVDSDSTLFNAKGHRYFPQIRRGSQCCHSHVQQSCLHLRNAQVGQVETGLSDAKFLGQRVGQVKKVMGKTPKRRI